MILPNTNLISVGMASSIVQAMPARITAAAEELGIQPTIRINNIPHFDENDLEIIAQHLRSNEAGGMSQRASQLG